MRKSLFILALTVLAAVSCGGNRIMSRSDFKQIYEEMFIADQWLIDNSSYREMADTTLFYEPIFNKYGYTREDYIASVEYYLSEPKEYSVMMTEIAAELNEKALKVADDARIESERLDRLQENLKNGLKDYSGMLGVLKERSSWSDTIMFERDSMLWRRPSLHKFVCDTTFDGVKMIIAVPDTVAVAKADSLAVADSLAKVPSPDTLAVSVALPEDEEPADVIDIAIPNRHGGVVVKKAEGVF